jgi:hypothetical protein
MDSMFQSNAEEGNIFSNPQTEKVLSQLSSSFQEEKIKNAIEASNDYTLENIKKTNLLKTEIWDKIIDTNLKLKKSYDVFDNVSEKMASDALNAEENRKEANQYTDKKQKEFKKHIESTFATEGYADKKNDILEKVSSSVGLNRDKLENSNKNKSENKTVEGSLLPTLIGIVAGTIAWDGLKFAAKKIGIEMGLKALKSAPEIAAVGYLAALPTSVYIDKKYGKNTNEKINPKRSDIFGIDMMLSDELKYAYSLIEAVKAPFRYTNEIFEKLNLKKSFKNLKTVLANAKMDLKIEGLLENLRYNRWVNATKSAISNVSASISTIGASVIKAVPILQNTIQRTGQFLSPVSNAIQRTSQFLSSVSTSISNMGANIVKTVPILKTAIQRTLPALRTFGLVSTGFLKMAGKRLPFIGAIWNGVEAAMYAWEGDWQSAIRKAIEATVVQALWFVPYVGWAASIGLSLYIDNWVAKHREEMKKAKAIAEDTQKNIEKETKEEIEKLKGVNISKEGKVEIPEDATPLTEEDKMKYKGTTYTDPVTKKEYFVTDDKTGSIPPPEPIYYDPEKQALGRTLGLKSDYDQTNPSEPVRLKSTPKEEKWLTLPTIPQTPPPIPLPPSVRSNAEMPPTISKVSLDEESIKRILDASSSEGQGSVINIGGGKESGGGSSVNHIIYKTVEDYRRTIRNTYK